MGSGLPDPSTAPAATAPIPQTAFENKPPPGQRGPKGLAGRQTFSRVNTGTPPTPDAGQSQQKSMAPLGTEFLPKTAQLETFMTTTAMPRPTLHDFIKTAMEASAAKVDLSLESARQVAETGAVLPGTTKTASAQQQYEIPTEYIDKLASALDYVARSLNPKIAEETTDMGPGQGPNALETNKGKLPTEDNIDANQTGEAHHKPPMAPATQKLPGQKGDPGGSMETNISMMHGEQPVEPISNEKTSSAYVNNLISMGLVKVAQARNGQLYLEPANELVKQAFGASDLGSYVGSTTGGGAYGGAAGAVKGGLAGGVGGGALGSLVGAGIGGLTGGLPGAAIGAGLAGMAGAGVGSAGGALAGGTAGAAKGAYSGFQRARAGGQARAAQEPKTASVRKLADFIGPPPDAVYEAAGMAPPSGGAFFRGAPGQRPPALPKMPASDLAQTLMSETGPATVPYLAPPNMAEFGVGRGAPKLESVGATLQGLGAAPAAAAAEHAAPAEVAAAKGLLSHLPKSTLGRVGLGAGAAAGLAGLGYGAYRGAKALMGRGEGGEEAPPEDMEAAKAASARLSARNLMVLGLYKQAEDAINPAQISAGKADAVGPQAPSGAAPAGQEVPSEPSDVSAQKRRMLSSNESAINYTKRDAKSDPKSDLGDVLTEPAQTSGTDKVLDETVEHTDSAGAKISSITRVAAARAILSKLAEEMGGKDKKEKRSQGLATTPSQASGFNAAGGGAGGM